MVYRSVPRWTTLQRLEKDFSISFEPVDDEMNSHRSKGTIQNGYSHYSSLSLTTQECHAQLVTTGQSSQTEYSTMRWGKCQKLQHNSASVRDCLKECSFVRNLCQTQTPLPSRKCVLELPTQFIGHINYGAPVCVMDQQSVSVKDPKSSGQTDSNHHTFKKCHKLKSSCSSNVNPSSLDSTRQKSMGLSVVEGDGPKPLREVIFTTEVPQKAIFEKGNSDKWENKSDMFGKDLSGETHIFSSKNTQKILQDQIQRVVVNLEEVLQDLKEVHMEMKEVVQQIDQLTSSIDLGEEVAKEDSRGVPEEVSVHKKIRKHQFMDTSECANSPSENPSTLPRNNKRFQASGTDQLMAKHTTHLTPPAYPTGTNCLVLKHNHGASENKGAKSEATKGSRRKKPPPYPFSSRAGTGNKEKDTGLNTLPYSGRRKVLSTTV